MPAVPFINDQGHIIIMADNKRVLVDTGSSFTIGEEECDIGGIHIVPQQRMFGYDIATMRQATGFNLDMLLGLNYLVKKNIQIRYNDCMIDFGDFNPADNYIQKTMGNFMNQCIFFPVVINGIETNAIFDTGAPLSYINPDFIKSQTPIGTREDFHVLVGRYESPIYNCTVHIGDEANNLTFGVVPPKLQPMMYLTMKMLRCDAVIGTELLQYYNCALLWDQKKILWELA
jgi:hypothetical protein